MYFNFKRGVGALVALVLALTVAGAPAYGADTTSPPTLTAAQVKAADKPVGVRAPKGQPAITKPNARLAVNYFYSGAGQNVVADGISAQGYVSDPYLNGSDYHTLGEIAAIQSISGVRQIVEIGFIKNAAVCGTTAPCLFGYHWVNSAGTCYNGCGFVDYAPNTMDLGDPIPAGDLNTVNQFAIQYSGGNWWLLYDGNWVGYYPGTLWSSVGVTFTQVNQGQAFYELTTPSSTPCSDLSTGVVGTQGSLTSGRWSTWTLVNPAGGAANAYNFAIGNGHTGKFHAHITTTVGSTRTVWAGGPGWNAAGTANGTAGSC